MKNKTHPSVEEMVEEFMNLDIETQGKWRIERHTAKDWLTRTLTTLREDAVREERFRVLELATKIISNPVEFMELTVASEPDPPQPITNCKHEWIDATNEKISGTMYCDKCGKLKPLTNKD